MKKIKILGYVLSLPLLATHVGVISSCDSHNLVPSEITINPSTTSIEKGKTFQLTASVMPSGASQEVVWSSSDNNIASIDENGLVTAKNVGDVVITAKPKGYIIQAFCNIQITPTRSDRIDFNTCQWSTITDACNKLEQNQISEQEFLAKFCVDDPSTPYIDWKDVTSFNDFVGQKRTVNINGLDHKVVVLGCKQDFQTYDPSSGIMSDPTIFTFQFNNLICDQDDNIITCYWDAHDNKNYWNSILYDKLNDDVGDAFISVYEMMKAGPDRLFEQIKPVYRGVNIYNNDLSTSIKYELIIKPTQIFCLTIGNIFSAKGISASTLVTDELEQQLYCNEGNQYDYFAQNIGDNPFEYEGENECLQFTNCDGTQSWFNWITSPIIGDDPTSNLNGIIKAWCLNGLGGIDCDNVYGESGMAPCFCI